MTICLSNQFCKLREFTFDDITQTYVNWLNDEEINRFLESRFEKNTLESVNKQARLWINNENYIYFTIRCPISDEHVGNIKLGPINQYHQTADVGYIIGRKDYTGKGIATNALVLLSDFAFKNGVKKIIAGAYVVNLASIRVMEKAGYSLECIRKSHVVFDDKRIDSVLYAKYAS
jgi:ribosomal-protein-alanine N-acetyltransferase